MLKTPQLLPVKNCPADICLRMIQAVRYSFKAHGLIFMAEQIEIHLHILPVGFRQITVNKFVGNQGCVHLEMICKTHKNLTFPVC